jgi:hypothetical protein
MTDTGTIAALAPTAQERPLPPATLSGMAALSRFGIPLGLAHARDAALAAFGIAAFFWLVIGTIVTVRLMTGGDLTAAAKTGLSAYLAAPATANIAWMLSHPGPVGAIQLGLTAFS